MGSGASRRSKGPADKAAASRRPQDTFGTQDKQRGVGLSKKPIALDSDEDDDVEDISGRIGRTRSFFEQADGSKKRLPDREIGKMLDEVAKSSAR